MTELPNVEQSYGVEIARKAIHLCSLSIPVVYYFVSRGTALTILVPLTAAFLAADLARLTIPAARTLFDRFFGFLLRSREQQERRLNGATYVLISATLCVLIFPKIIVVTAFAILIVSDSAAALIGRKFGRHPFLSKTREGAGAFLVSALLVVLVAPKVDGLPAEYLIGFAGALLGSVVESMPTNIDDNLSIPVSIGLLMWLLYAILLPSVNVFKLDVLG